MPDARTQSNSSVDLDRSAVARYLQLSTHFRRRIEYGEWPVGQQIPTLGELTTTYGVAPATIRKALDSLVEEGLIARYRAKGTYVIRSPVQSLWTEIQNDSEGFLKARDGPSITVLSNRLVPAPPLKPAEGDLLESYRLLRRVYSRDNRPFLLMDLYIDAELAKSISRRDAVTKTARELIEAGPRRLPISLRQVLTISSADVETTNFLSIPLNSPIARIERTRTDRDGRLITISNGIYRGDVVRLDFVETEGS